MERSVRGPDLMVTERMPDGPWVTEAPLLVVETTSTWPTSSTASRSCRSGRRRLCSALVGRKMFT